MKELSDPLTDDDKAWLRSWNRGNEIPGEEDAGNQTLLVPGAPPGGELNPAGQTDADPFGGEEPPEDYNDWTVPQLQGELGNRSLPKSGNKADLVSRLAEDDANEDDDEDPDA